MNDDCRSAAHAARRATEQAAGWYLDQREGLPVARQQAFLAWLRHSPLHVAEYLAIARLHGDLKAAAAMETMSTTELGELAASESAIVTLHPRAAAMPARSQARTWQTARARRRLRWGIAAGVATLLLSAAAWLHVPASQDLPADIYASTANEGRSFTLADGSLVQLDRDSAIAVRFDVHSRQIEVTRGGALFDVGKDPARPLQVRLGDNQLQDIGTVFSARRQAGGGIVTVLSGKVNLLAPAHPWLAAWQRRLGRTPEPDTVVAALGGGHQAVLGGDGAVIALTAHVDIAQATAWLPADIRFQHSTVAEVARRFNAYTSLPLVIDDSKVAAMRISGVFHARDAEAFTAYLSSLPGVQVQRDDLRVRVFGAAPAVTHRQHRL
jgi:transmembrane sensor